MWETSRNKLKKHSVSKIVRINCFGISNFLQILGLHAEFQVVFLGNWNIFFLIIGQNNFGNKIPYFVSIFASWFLCVRLYAWVRYVLRDFTLLGYFFVESQVIVVRHDVSLTHFLRKIMAVVRSSNQGVAWVGMGG